MNKFNLFAVLFALTFVLLGCAREVSENSDEVEKRYLEAYNTQNGGTYTITASGMYYINKTEGTGSIKPQDSQFAFIRYTMRSLSGDISQTTIDSLAKQLGTYRDSLYYGPSLASIGTDQIYTGMEEALKEMSDGAQSKFIMPTWLSTYYDGGTRALASPMIFDITMIEVVPDIAQWQTDTLEHFSDKRFSGLDSTDYNFYYEEILSGSGDTAANADTLKISYVGYLLDGFVFDTNIADSADIHHIYNSSKTYAAMSVVKSEMSFVEGFKKALQTMKDGSEAWVFFSSDYGYKDVQQGQIPPYSPLCFYIKLEIGRVEE